MPRSAGRLRLTLPRALFAILLLAVVLAAAALPRAGTFLIRTDTPSRSDVLFVLAGTKLQRSLEAVDLYKAGLAPVILLSPGIVEEAEVTLRARGVRVPSDAEITRDVIVQLGVPSSAILTVDGSIDNTAQEALLLRRMAAQHGWHSVIVVTSRYHTRRSAFAFHRAFKGTDMRIAVVATRHDGWDPERWWRHRADIRFVSSELQKLLLYRLGLSD